MGVKYFFKWFKESFPKTISKYDKKRFTKNPKLLMLDLNSLIHNACQKVYQYGAFESKVLLRKSPNIASNEERDQRVFETILESISALVLMVDPQEIVICIDGVAPISKQIQQRQRRFLTTKTDGGFDSNCISPGTDFLYKCGIYLKSHLEKKLATEWLNVTTIYFMDSLVPGEGEHKLFDYLRMHNQTIEEKKFTVFIVGNDADLIMVALLVSAIFLQRTPIYILREDTVTRKTYLTIDINQFKQSLTSFAQMKPKYKTDNFARIACDFIILCFLVGNDFLPPIPLFNIYDGGLDLMMKHYFASELYLTTQNQPQSTPPGLRAAVPTRSSLCDNERLTPPGSGTLKKFVINLENIRGFFKHILTISHQSVQHYRTRNFGYPNTLLDVTLKKEPILTDVITHYLRAYSLQHNITKELTHSYLLTIDWIFNYYLYGGSTIDWNHYYPSQFAPTVLDLQVHLNSFAPLLNPNNESVVKGALQPSSKVTDPFFQLLCILPPHSAHLLPPPLNEALLHDLKAFHPSEIEIDYDGKLNSWEGIPILPHLNHEYIYKVYKDNLEMCSALDLVRNKASNQVKMSVV
jgi:5'-3' exonuclease